MNRLAKAVHHLTNALCLVVGAPLVAAWAIALILQVWAVVKVALVVGFLLLLALFHLESQ